MSRIEWDAIGAKKYETGVNQGVLYPYDSSVEDKTKAYAPGVAWNGLSSVTESPSGAEATAIYADNIKYLNLYSAEELGATVECYTYPDEWEECDGSAEVAPGVTIGQQSRKTFGLAYKTIIGNDTDGDAHGYKLHLLYGCKASPSEKAYQTVNDSPEAISFSYTITTTPVNVKDHKPTANMVIDSTKYTTPEAKARLKALEDVLYGTESAEPYLPLPDEVIAILTGTQAAG